MNTPTERPFYEEVGTEGGTVDTPNGPVEVVGIMYPLENSHIDDVYDVRYMTIAAAKALIIDLQDTIDACLEHQGRD